MYKGIVLATSPATFDNIKAIITDIIRKEKQFSPYPQEC